MSDLQRMDDGTSWTTWSVCIFLAMAIASALIGMLWLPSVHADFRSGGLWSTICAAAGQPRRWLVQSDSATSPGTSRVVLSGVAFPSAVRGGVPVQRGESLASSCDGCHEGAATTGGGFPVLDGLPPEAIYKQLRDFKEGERRNAIMQAMTASLSETDMRALADFYARRPRTHHGTETGVGKNVPSIVQVGAPMRNIAPCTSCHGGVERKLGAPTMEGAPATYLEAQLRAFAEGKRTNDINAQMRNVARHMRDDEIVAAAEYYAKGGSRK